MSDLHPIPVAKARTAWLEKTREVNGLQEHVSSAGLGEPVEGFFPLRAPLARAAGTSTSAPYGTPPAKEPLLSVRTTSLWRKQSVIRAPQRETRQLALAR